MISTTGRPATTAASKTRVILNGKTLKSSGIHLEPEVVMDTEEEEEEEDTSSPETRSSGQTSPSSVSHCQPEIAQGEEGGGARGVSPRHGLQEDHTSTQFPLSGDLPRMDPGLPSPSLGFELAEVSLMCNGTLKFVLHFCKLGSRYEKATGD